MNPAEKIRITVNGEPREIAAAATVVSMLQELGVAGERVAVELNRTIVRKPDWPATPVPGDSQVEIVEFVGGG